MEKFAAFFNSGLLRLHWAPGTFITYEIAVQAARVLEKLGGGQTLPLLVDIAGVAGLAPEARAGMNAYRGFSVIALLGDHPVGTVLAAFAKQSLTPTAYFTDEESALRWLAQQNGGEYRTALMRIPDAPSGQDTPPSEAFPSTTNQEESRTPQGDPLPSDLRPDLGNHIPMTPHS